MEYDDVVSNLRTIYDARADAREVLAKHPWKKDERAAFLDRLRAVEASTLLEIGAGVGHDSRFFADAGLDVTAVDIAPGHVERCRAKGVRAEVRDVLHLGFAPASFDAVWSMNCLVHVPDQDLPAALRAIHDVLVPGGLFYLGVWGGEAPEGIMEGDGRFFSFRSNERLLTFAAASFDLVDFHVISRDWEFQALTLARPPAQTPTSPPST
ncbi:class I SAM-dependent methyltransferase [Actinoplanes sp. N902-109]|uniref:class I SAM-dependent methyltransferase n=1 Tax=Actinoplanes sp. (strain N902-109) TaxID=649831 RepID=UPI0003295F36|nr:class I SAM-dependent methyltransferase [Actinoplanes sp. N902-109]AGL14402.1 type 11 methyltransferase [Actinoplanes sp. N902-109]